MAGTAIEISVKELQEKVNELLATEKLPNPKLFPTRILVHETKDSAGDEALDVILVFADQATDEQLRWKNSEVLHEAVRRLVEEQDANGRFVYVWARRKRELSDTGRP